MFDTAGILTLALCFSSTELPGDALPSLPPTPVLSSDLLDPEGLTRFHLTSRVTFAGGGEAFTSGFAWAYEARAHIRMTEGLAISATLPFGLYKEEGSPDTILGNLSVGLGGGGEVLKGPLRLRLGGGLDGHFPTTSGGDLPENEGAAFLAAIRAYEPQLFIPSLAAIRARGSVDMEMAGLRLSLELAVIPAFTTEAPTGVLFLIGAAGRVSYVVTRSVEPFVELGAVTQVAGDGDLAPPLLITPGVRFHVADLFDPAIFASFNFVAGSTVIFGVDLALAFRPEKKKEKRDVFDRQDAFF